MSNRKSINVQVPMPPDLAAWLDDEAKRRMMPRAQLVRAWVQREMEGQTLERLGRLHEGMNEIRLLLKKHDAALVELAGTVAMLGEKRTR